MSTVSLVPTDALTDAWTIGVKRLQRMLPPKGFAMDRWALICMDCSRLLEHHGADLLRLGWTTEDAFGVHPHAPAAAVRCYGFGLLLNGGEVIEMTERHARAKLPSGAVQTFVRTAKMGAVPVWTLEE